MKKPKYTMSEKRKQLDESKADFDRRIEIFMLMNQGWKSKQVAEKIGTTRQNVENTYKKIKNQTIDELTELRNKYQSKLPLATSNK